MNQDEQEMARLEANILAITNLVDSLRTQNKEFRRVLGHFIRHSYPKPTPSGEYWLNKAEKLLDEDEK